MSQEPVAVFRPYDEESHKRSARFYIAKGQMEGLTTANLKIYTNPITLALWAASSAVFAMYAGWMPPAGWGYVGYLFPLVPCACMALPFMFGADWFQRSQFETDMENTLRKRDLIDIKQYYSRSPASGFWILEYGKRFVGLIAIDASLDSASDDVVIDPEAKDKAKSKAEEDKAKDKPPTIEYKNGTSETAVIRHLVVDEPYRKAFMQDDLLQHALKHAFTNDAKVKSVRTLETALLSYVGEALKKEGFKTERTVATQGIFKWPVRSAVLKREDWKDSGSTDE